jgi:hypothetical protein
MARADLHVHSKYSLDGDEWTLKTLGVRESYTELDQIYRAAKSRKMDFITVTDHNSIEGSLRLARKYPAEAFVSCEFSVVFPENHCKVHILVFDLTEKQFEKLQGLRPNIYMFRDYIRAEKLAYSVAHATLSVNRKIDRDCLEKLILLFDVFESVNGAHAARHNREWTEALERLTEEDIERLRGKHRIEPFSKNSWIKGLTGGSDDHAGLFIGDTFTMAPCRTKHDFLQSLRNKETLGFGRNHDYKSMALSFILIGGHIYSDLAGERSSAFISREIGGMLRGDKSHAGMLRFFSFLLAWSPRNFHRVLGKFFSGIFQGHSLNSPSSAIQRIDLVYKQLTFLLDEIVRNLIRVLGATQGRAGKARWLKKSILATTFLGAPFFAALRLLNHNKSLLEDLEFHGECPAKTPKAPARTLWFSDAVRSRQGLEEFRSQRELSRNNSVKVAVCSRPRRPLDCAAAMDLPMVGLLRRRFFHFFSLRIPSVLGSLSVIEKWAPDQIVIDTPGPVGLLGFIAARMLDVKCLVTFSPEVSRTDLPDTDDGAFEAVEKYLKYLHSLADGEYRGKALHEKMLFKRRNELFENPALVRCV